MTPQELTVTLDVLGWSARHVAGLLGCERTLPLRWQSGRARVPAPVAAWLWRLRAAHERHPAPRNWRTQSAR